MIPWGLNGLEKTPIRSARLWALGQPQENWSRQYMRHFSVMADGRRYVDRVMKVTE